MNSKIDKPAANTRRNRDDNFVSPRLLFGSLGVGAALALGVFGIGRIQFPVGGALPSALAAYHRPHRIAVVWAHPARTAQRPASRN